MVDTNNCDVELDDTSVDSALKKGELAHDVQHEETTCLRKCRCCHPILLKYNPLPEDPTRLCS